MDDDDRWAAIWRHHDALVRLARPRVTSESDAEDVVHEAMALAAAKQDLDLETAGAWLNRVVRNRCVDLVREQSYADKCVVYEHGRSIVQSPTEDIVCDRAEAAYLNGVLQTLPSRQHEALVHVSAGMTNAQIAAAMSTTVKAIESLLVKARRTLRAAAAALVAGFAVIFRRRPGATTSTVSAIALSVGVTVCILQPPAPQATPNATRQRIAIKAETWEKPVAQQERTRAPVRKVVQQTPHTTTVALKQSVPPRGPGLHLKAGPTHSDAGFEQHGSLTNPMPDIKDCLEAGVVVLHDGYTGCRNSRGR
jgi:RNA polymerase sigma factor (sigma-70 family)